MLGRSVVGLSSALFACAVSGCSCGEIILQGAHPGGASDAGAVDGRASEGGQPIDSAADAGIGGPHSGSRIKVRGLQLGDALVPSGVLWDDLRGVQCSPTLAADGTERCMPSTGQRVVWFTDSSCKNPVIVEQSAPDPCAAQDPHPYATVSDLLVCPPTGFKVYGKGAPVNTPPELYSLTRAGCDLIPPVQSSGWFYDAVPSPSSDWVRFRHDVTKVTEQLGVAYWDGTDGSRVLDGLRLLPDDIACSETMVDGSTPVPPVDVNVVARCIPSNRLGLNSSYFTSATCTDPVGFTLDCPSPALVTGVPMPAPGVNPSPCTGTATVQPLFRAVAVPSLSVYTTSGAGVGPGPDAGSCTPTPFGGFYYYGAGAPVQFEGYPAVTVTPTGTGRFQQIQTSSEGHELFVDANELYDNRTATICRPQDPTGDGRTFCVSDVGIASNPASYSDAACTKPLATIYGNGSCRVPSPLAASVSNPGPAPCASTPLLKILGVHAGPTYSSPSGNPSGSCLRDTPSPGTVSYDLGSVVDPATLFPLLTPRDL